MSPNDAVLMVIAELRLRVAQLEAETAQLRETADTEQSPTDERRA